jgi:hemerythrin-like domain-containing protein
MKYASDDLKHEHEAILFSLKVLEVICGRLESGDKVPVDDLMSLTGFLKLFADKCHHGKEEMFFFPALEEAGIQEQNGPIGMLLEEHEKGRVLLSAMSSAGSGGGIKKDEFIPNARDYISLLRSHIDKENNLVFAIGDEKLSPQVNEKLLKEFDKFEDEVIGKGKHAELHVMLQEFKEKYIK